MKYFITIFNLFNPFFLIKKLFMIWKDFSNLIFYRRVIKYLDSTGQLKLYNLKVDWWKRMYTAINMKPELLMYHTDAELITFEKTILGNEISKLDDFFIKHNILEYMIIKYNRVLTNTHYAYKLRTRYRWRNLTFGWFMWYIFYIFFLIYLIKYIPSDYVTAIYESILEIFTGGTL